MDPRAALVRRLADGALHDTDSLARAAGIEPDAVPGALRALSAWGLDVESPSGLGHRLVEPLELLDSARIAAALEMPVRERLNGLEVLDEVDSTNARLLALPAPPEGRGRACAAEFQNAGRGRRGRAWTQPYASGLCLSLGWSFAGSSVGLGALSLAAGVAVLRALDGFGVGGLALKWPNDVLRGGAKLGGILCELRSLPEGPVHVVIGVGLNVRLSDDARAGIVEGGGLEPADLADVRPRIARNRLAARLLGTLAAMAEEFAAQGFAPFTDEWRAADALRDRAVRVLGPSGREGVARGIDIDGALCIEIGGRLERLTAGDVSLRAVA